MLALPLAVAAESAEAKPTTATQAASMPVLACAALAGRTLGRVRIVDAADVAASEQVPAYCRVQGTEIDTQHDIEVRLPATWQSRFVVDGGGGFDGSVPPVGNQNIALRLGAVQTVNNGGHRDPSGADFLNNPAVVARYAHTAILTATRFGKAVAQTYYGHRPSYAYYEGCSNGGRGALNAASRYGNEFDGVIAGAPTTNVTGQIEQWTRAAALTLPNATKLSAIYAAAVAKCDALDGLSDGIVANWAQCRFNPAVDVPASVGLTKAEAASVKALQTDLIAADGQTLYSGYGYGDMSMAAPDYAILGSGHMRNIVLNDPAWLPTSFNVNAYHPKITAVIDGRYGFSAPIAGLAQFLDAGKKIIAWQGSDDALLSHRDTVRNWLSLLRHAGSAGAANARLYIAAGVGHCQGGPGADAFDLLTPLIAWVEHGVAPGTISAAKMRGGSVQFTRPLCVAPRYAKYRGTGDTSDAANFTCALS